MAAPTRTVQSLYSFWYDHNQGCADKYAGAQCTDKSKLACRQGQGEREEAD